MEKAMGERRASTSYPENSLGRRPRSDDPEEREGFGNHVKGTGTSTLPFSISDKQPWTIGPFIELVLRPHAETIPLTTRLGFFRRSPR
jgi:hypothetical protein